MNRLIKLQKGRLTGADPVYTVATLGLERFKKDDENRRPRLLLAIVSLGSAGKKNRGKPITHTLPSTQRATKLQTATKESDVWQL